MNEFVDYVMSFYGKDEIYDIGTTKQEILIATGIRLERLKEVPFHGDSLDREAVRDIIIESRNKA